MLGASKRSNIKSRGAMKPNDAHDQDVVPEIALRVPGPWEGPAALERALREKGLGYGVVDGGIVEVRGDGSRGRVFAAGASPPDDEIADIFADTGRLSDEEVEAIRRHACKVHVSAPGGSVEAARAIMDVATALLHAGGTGVMVDSSTNAHSRRDWLDLSSDPQPGGLYWAYVAVIGSPHEIFSIGMHCLGMRDAELPDPPDRELGGFVIHNFLGYAYQSGVPVLDGDTLGDESAPRFRAVAYPCYRVKPGTPFYNPYGVWRLEPVEPA